MTGFILLIVGSVAFGVVCCALVDYAVDFIQRRGL